MLQNPKFRKKFNYNSHDQSGDDLGGGGGYSDSEEESEVWDEEEGSGDEERDRQREKLVRQKRIDSNPFLKMIVQNVDKAFKYNPMK